MIDVTGPDLLSFAQACALLPPDSRGRRFAPQTVVRWATKGRAGVILESARVGRAWYTTAAALSAFCNAAPRPAAARVDPKAATRSHESAVRELEAAGL